jgi:hypothetical protein
VAAVPLHLVSTVGRNEEMIRAYIRNQREQTRSWIRSSRPEVLSLVPDSFITASGGSPSNPQLCWGLLACYHFQIKMTSRWGNEVTDFNILPHVVDRFEG